MMDETIVQSSVDTLHAGALEGEANLFSQLLHHVRDSREVEIPFLGHVELPQFPPFEIAGITIDMSITKHVFFLWVAALLLCTLAIIAARKNKNHVVPTGFGNLMEILVVFIRDQVVVPNMGPQGITYMPYLLTTFFFIVIMNLLGLVPFGASATGNVSTTAGLAIIAFIMIQVAAIRAHGLGRYLAHLTGGVHWALWPITVPIEILGLFTKPFALCMRLFANMTAGHIVIVSLIGLIFVFGSYIVAVAPVGFVLGIDLLEIFVAVLQAYIFTILTAMFMGLGMQLESHDEA